VKILGYKKDVNTILAKADIFALISNWEGFPLTTLEAMRVGLPVIVSDVGGAAEAVDDKKTGYVVQRGDVLGIKKALEALAGNPALRNRLGTAAQNKYRQNFCFEKMYDKTIKIYQALC
jgi:glycosyltransferase involved in cell wall biosynthesis